MQIRKFDRSQLESEPHNVLFRDLYPWDQIGETPFGASLAVVDPGGRTMEHNHNPAETFVICQGRGTMTINGESCAVSAGDVIYMEPDSSHFLQNDSDCDPLMFLSVFWDAVDAETPAPRAVLAARLHYPSPPTPNGPLHLGHLAGPYLAADVARRYDRMRGRASSFLCLSDEHQTYAELRGHFDQRPPADSTAHFSDNILALLRALDAEPDRFVRPSRDAGYAEAVQAAWERLRAAGHLTLRETTVMHCPACQRDLYDGHLVGSCPSCQARCRGYLCESCCLPNQGSDLLEPTCLHCEGGAEPQTSRRWVFQAAPFREKLAAYHGSLRLTPRLRSLAHQFLALPTLEIRASRTGPWGIPVPGDEDGQRISPWLEVSLAAHFLNSGNAEICHFFGYDNAFLYLVQDPAVSLALAPERPLPTVLASNEYLLLGDMKMSTSSSHCLDAAEVLRQFPADLVRLYLAGIRPEQTQTSCSLAAMQQFLEMGVIGPWQTWLEALGRSLTSEASSKAPGPVRWSPEHHEFLATLSGLLARARQGYETLALQDVARILHELVERASRFGQSQSHLRHVPELLGERATGLTLELAAARLLAQCAAPLMPKFAATLWKHLGFRDPIDKSGWSDQVELVPPGQRILAMAGLVTRRYFPATLALTPA